MATVVPTRSTTARIRACVVWEELLLWEVPRLGQIIPMCTKTYIHRLTRNLAIANKSRVSCAHNTLKASRPRVTPWLWKCYWESLETAPFDKLYTSYLTLNIKLTLKCGHPRSFKMAPFDTPCTTFYWSSIVTIALSCTIFEFIFSKHYEEISCLMRLQVRLSVSDTSKLTRVSQ